MAAPYTKQKQILPGKASLAAFSSPAAFEINNTLQVYYHGIGNDGFWFTSTSSRTPDVWAGPTSIKKQGAVNLMPFPGTTPSPVLFKGEIYIWYTNINLEIWGVRAEKGNGRWTQAFPIWGAITGEKKIIAPPTSIQTAVYNDLLYFFWIIAPGYEAVNRMQYATYDGAGNWSAAKTIDAPGMGIMPGTSSCVNVFKDTLYVYYDGCGGDGTWVATFKDGKWAPVQSMAAIIGSPGGSQFIDPDSWTSSDGKTLVVSNLYMTWTGQNKGTVIGTSQDGKTYSTPIEISESVGGQGITLATSARGSSFLNRSHLFWNGVGEAGLWYTRETTAPKIMAEVEETFDDPSIKHLPYPGMNQTAVPQTLFQPYSDFNEKMAFDLPVSESVPHLDNRVRAKGLLPTVGEVKRYGCFGAFARKYLAVAAKIMLVFIALVLMTLGWHYVSPAWAHGH